MTTVNKSAFLPYSAVQMFDLVNDIEAYPEFLPWCKSARILARDGAQVRAKVALAKGMIRQEFTTLNTNQPSRRIDLKLIEGPFKYLNGSWHFEPRGEIGCKVSLNMDFEFSTGIVGLAFGRMFNELMSTLVAAFAKRAEQQYGQR